VATLTQKFGRLVGWLLALVWQGQVHRAEMNKRQWEKLKECWRAKKGGAPVILLWPGVLRSIERGLLDLVLLCLLIWVSGEIVAMVARWRRRRREGLDPQELKREADRYMRDGPWA
jgi:hypothetical protein